MPSSPTRTISTLTGTATGVTRSRRIPPSWHETIQHDWEDLIGGDRLDRLVEELRELIEVIEETTGRRYDAVPPHAATSTD